MNAERVRKLEALLDRVQRNANAPRSQVAETLVRHELASQARSTAPVAGDAVRVAPAPASTEQPIAGSPRGEAPSVAQGPRPAERAVVREAMRQVPESVQAAPSSDDIEDVELVEEGELLELDETDALPDEDAPASSRRVAASMDEALAGAADQLESPKTVPPESGPEPLGSGELELRQSLPGQDLRVPTTEQLGQTVSLEEGAPADFELDEPLHEPPAVGGEESQLEAELPSGGAGYREDLASPPGAREELERVRLGEVRAEVIARPIISTNVVEFIQAQSGQRPQSFAALLDEALSLGAD